MPKKKNPATTTTSTTAAPKKTRTAKPPVDPATLPAQMPKLFTPREIARLQVLSTQAIDLQTRAAELLKRGEKNMEDIYSLCVPDTATASDAFSIMADVNGNDGTFAEKVNLYACKVRASDRIATARRKADELAALFDGPATDAFHDQNVQQAVPKEDEALLASDARQPKADATDDCPD